VGVVMPTVVHREPAGHGVCVVMPSFGQMEPAGHLVSATIFSRGQYEPAGHFWAPKVVGQNEPFGHAMQSLASALPVLMLKVPAGHWVALVIPVVGQ
jgi:hypothetical protein